MCFNKCEIVWILNVILIYKKNKSYIFYDEYDFLIIIKKSLL